MSVDNREVIEQLNSFYEMDEMYAAAQYAIQALEEIQQYRAIGTLEEVKQAVERMKPKKPEICADIYHGGKFIGRDYRCSNCGFGVADDYLCCPYCGQYLD